MAQLCNTGASSFCPAETWTTAARGDLDDGMSPLLTKTTTISIPKINFALAQTRFVTQYLVAGAGGVAQSTPTDQKPSIAPIIVHSFPGIQYPKEKPAGDGWGILNKRRTGSQGARGSRGNGASIGGGSATRGDATTSRGK
jgi:hypothetical protein